MTSVFQRRPCGHRDRHWNGVSISQGTLVIASKRGMRQILLERLQEDQPCQYFDFELLVSRNYQVCMIH